MGQYRTESRMGAYGWVQHSNKDAVKPDFSCDNLLCRSKLQSLFTEEEGRKGREEREDPGPSPSV